MSRSRSPARRSHRDDYRNDRHHRQRHRRDRSDSRSPDRSANRRQRRSRSRSNSRERRKPRHDERRRSPRPREDRRWGLQEQEKKPEEEKKDKPQDKPNFGLSGKLLEDTNKVQGSGTVLKYAEPPEARKPKIRWRLYPFKGSEELPILYIHRQSSYLCGRDRKVADIPTDHPSCSKQHAVIQFRQVHVDIDGSSVRRVKPYLIDLNSGNGTILNGEKIEPQRYVELFEKDVIKFGFSSREYVLMHEGAVKEGGDEDEGEQEVKKEEELIVVKRE